MGAGGETENVLEGRHRGATPVEAEAGLIQGGLEMS
jgi:hypothetical protein